MLRIWLITIILILLAALIYQRVQSTRNNRLLEESRKELQHAGEKLQEALLNIEKAGNITDSLRLRLFHFSESLTRIQTQVERLDEQGAGKSKRHQVVIDSLRQEIERIREDLKEEEPPSVKVLPLNRDRP